jgi:hypothetical protein
MASSSIRHRFRLKIEKVFPLSFLMAFMVLPVMGQLAPEPKTGNLAGQVKNLTSAPEPGLLFYLSGEKGGAASFAASGQNLPNYFSEVKIIPDGAVGSAFEAGDTQLMTYWAPGNIYAQRGTLSFFWRSRYPVGPTEFPVFRVAYADHSSWDMVWLRIDYNGSGFDAFVTDIGLTRTRVSHHMEKFPDPNAWTHIALSWDETEGIRFYINGTLAGKQSVNGNVFDSGLDQFGPHSRIISPYQVQSRYSFMRGGDLDEVRIYDRMLSDDNIRQLSKGKTPKRIPDLRRDLSERRWRDAWWTRHGWNLPNDPPPLLASSATSVRKVEIHETYDIKRWMWKANDGIRETTWPGVYNMSRLPGRYDYFVLPDWDTYSGSGQSVKFHLPDEPWNHVEIWGKAWGQLTFESDHPYDNTFGLRSQKQVKSYHRINEAKNGGRIRFDNALIEEPIGTLNVYHVQEGKVPDNAKNEVFTLTSAPRDFGNEALKEVSAFINGRYPADERATMLAVPDGKRSSDKPAPLPEHTHPFIHILIPYTFQAGSGLDGVEVELPALKVKATHNGVFPLNIRIKDPLWQMRDLADFSFSVKPNEANTLWIDLRDKILPEGKALYLTLAGAGADFKPALLEGARLRLIYKSAEEAREEHELDRFTQIKDLYGFIVEERPRNPRLNLYNRFVADYTDLIRVNPHHWLAKTYWYATTQKKEDLPEYKIAETPEGIPDWAFLQTEYLRHLARIVNFYIDERQISNGEFGGGLSDDDDFSNMFPGTAFLGIEPEKTLQSLRLLMDAYYDQDRDPKNASLRQRSLPLFTNGLATISTDELHAYEEGIEAVGQLQLLDYGNPLHINRGMEVSRRLLKDVTQVNPDGHRHFRSRNYGGTRMATEDPWQWTEPYSYAMLHPAYMLVRYNGNPALRKMILELADGLLEHVNEKGELKTEIHFSTDQESEKSEPERVWQVLLAAYEYSGNDKYLKPIPGKVQRQREFNADAIAKRYKEEIRIWGVNEYINTKGSIWIDRLTRDFNTLQEDRLGGVALQRLNNILPQNAVSWNIDKPASYESIALYIQQATASAIKVIAYNLEEKPVGARMKAWKVEPGRWKVRQGLDTNDDQQIDTNATEHVIHLERGQDIQLSFPPRKSAIVELELVEKAPSDYWERPDLGIGPQDVKIKGQQVSVRVHSLGAVSTPETSLELRNGSGKLIASLPVPALEAPLDLVPRWVDLKLEVPKGTDLSSGSIHLDPEMKINQITRLNTIVKW